MKDRKEESKLTNKKEFKQTRKEIDFDELEAIANLGPDDSSDEDWKNK